MVESTPAERYLISVWEEVLGVDGLSPEADFFELGGDSVAAIELSIAIGDRIDSSVSGDIDGLIARLQWPKIRDLAQHIRT